MGGCYCSFGYLLVSSWQLSGERIFAQSLTSASSTIWWSFLWPNYCIFTFIETTVSTFTSVCLCVDYEFYTSVFHQFMCSRHTRHTVGIILILRKLCEKKMFQINLIIESKFGGYFFVFKSFDVQIIFFGTY